MLSVLLYTWTVRFLLLEKFFTNKKVKYIFFPMVMWRKQVNEGELGVLRFSILNGVISEVFLSEVTFKQRHEEGEKVSHEGSESK